MLGNNHQSNSPCRWIHSSDVIFPSPLTLSQEFTSEINMTWRLEKTCCLIGNLEIEFPRARNKSCSLIRFHVIQGLLNPDVAYICISMGIEADERVLNCKIPVPTFHPKFQACVFLSILLIVCYWYECGNIFSKMWSRLLEVLPYQ